jgi:hypothetical protein
MQEYSLEQLKSDLLATGLSPNDEIMVHSSLSSIGSVSGGADTVIQALVDTVTQTGTIMMPCYNSAEDVAQGMKNGDFVDLRVTPPVTGAITNAFRKWPDVIRSSHPFSSVCAWGTQAGYLIAEHASSPFICHDKSPLARMVERDMTIVGIGVPISVGLGEAHCLEDGDYNFPLKVHLPPFAVTYVDSGGSTINREVIRFDPVQSSRRIDNPRGAWILKMFTKHLTNLGIVQWSSVGDAKSWLMNAKPLFHELRRLADKGITFYLTKEEWLSSNEGNERIDTW